MAGDFQYDVFLSHSSKEKPVACAVTERLRPDGLSTGSQQSTLNPQPTSALLNKERRLLLLRLDKVCV